MATPEWMNNLKNGWGWIAGVIAVIGGLIAFVRGLQEDWQLGVVISGGVLIGILAYFFVYILAAKKTSQVYGAKFSRYENRWRILAGIGLAILGGSLVFLLSYQPSRAYIAEAFIGAPTPTPTLIPTSAPSATPSATLTLMPSDTPASTPAPTHPPTSCPYQGKTDSETFVNLINAEAQAVNQGSMETINMIFASDAYFYDGSKGQNWFSPKERYQDDLFINGTSQGVRHFGVSLAGKSGQGDVVWYTSGSRGFYDSKIGDDIDYYNGAKGETAYGSDHWTFRRNTSGCWVISQFAFNSGQILFPP